MISQSVRLFWRTTRFEIAAGVGLSLALTLGMVATSARLDEIRTTACFGERSCENQAWVDIQGSLAEPLMFGAVLLPLVIGLLFGPSLVGRELEGRSAPLVWSLVRSRVMWLTWRAWPAALLVVLLLLGPALAGDRLEAAAYPQYDPALSFNDVGARGELVVLRGLLVFAVGLTAGVVLGRTLPAVLVAGTMCLVGLGVASALRPAWLPREEIPRLVIDAASVENPLYFGEGFRLPDGRLLTIDESTPLRPPEAREFESQGYFVWLLDSGWTRVDIGIRGQRLREIELREGVSTGAAAVTAFGIGLLAVRRRRPVSGLALEPDARRAARVAAGDASSTTQAPWRRTGAWLSWSIANRVSRPELLGAFIASIAVTSATTIVIALLQDARLAQGCVAADCIGNGPFSRINNPLSDWLYPLLASLPFVVGGLLGTSVVARELEAGTAQLTWSLTGSRVAWLLWRITPLVLMTLVLLIPAALAGSELLRAQTLQEPTYYFSSGQIRGAPLVARGMVAFGVGVLAGILLRRTLPALVVVGIAGLILYNALDWMSVGGHWLRPDVLGTPGDTQAASVRPGSLVLTDALEAPDGTFHLAADVALTAGFARFSADGNLIEHDPDFIAWYVAHGYRQVTIGWDAGRYPEVVLRESAVLIGGSVIALVAAAGLIRRVRIR